MQMTRMLKRIGAVVLAAALTACGGGGSDAGCSVFSTSCTTTGTGSTTTTTTTPTTSTVTLSLSGSSVSASAPLTVTALLKSSAGEPIAGAVVNFTVTNGGAVPLPQRVARRGSSTAMTMSAMLVCSASRANR